MSPPQYYRTNFAAVAKNISKDFSVGNATIRLWAKCQFCQVIDAAENLESLSKLTIWTIEGLQEILHQRKTLLLATLRVYNIPQNSIIESDGNFTHKIGRFVGLPRAINVTEVSPILSDRAFSRRCHQLQNRLPPEHPELEDLEACVSQYTTNNPAAKALARDIQVFLSWSNDSPGSTSVFADNWISEIAEVGNSSDGNEFEKLVRKSFIKLGFSNSRTDRNLKDCLNPEKTGGAGGLDLYCDTPYAVVGECKATKTEKVPDGTPAQLVKLGQKFLNTTSDGQSCPGQYEKCIKMILAAGELTKAANQTAIGNQMNVLRPETLQKLVKLKVAHPGSIDLLELKSCLQNTPFGESADAKVRDYANKIWEKIKLRSRLVTAVRELDRQDSRSLDSPVKSFTVMEVRAHYNATQSPTLTDEQVRNILIELSSPLVGYIGKDEEGKERGDRFYFLKEFIN
ncbi:MAG: DUF1802 family protein [Cyanobacteriota bacterium]|nr:DUF1802 family protein [Cyanobacteriota bacterium]